MVRRCRRWGAPVLAVVLLPVINVAATPPAAAATGCSRAPYGISSVAPGNGKTVALTFDDGPGRDTRQIMAILAADHVTATFFNMGIHEAADHAIVRAQRAAGYVLADHTWDHQSLLGLDSAGQAAEIDRERSEQAGITGAYSCLFRPPYGSYDATTLALAQQRNMQIWNWSVDTEDWKAAGSGDAYWVDRITSRAEDGASQAHPVILMHNQTGGNPATVAALPRIIGFYRARGYAFVDLLGNTGPPSVRAVSPTLGSTRGGTRIAITGTGFTHVVKVTFGSISGTALRVVSPTRLYITSPRHLAGIAVIRVINTQGPSAHHTTDIYRYISPPTVISVSPAGGPPAGGTRVTFSGSNFTHVLVVKFGAAKGKTVRVLSPTRLAVTAPAHTPGIVIVVVTTSFGTSPVRVSARFRYAAPAAVISPKSVPADDSRPQPVSSAGLRTPTAAAIAGTDAPLITKAPTRLLVAERVPTT